MEKLRQVLDAHEVDYEIFHHERPLRSAKEGAAYFGISIGQTAPTLLINTERGYLAIIVSGDYGRVDLEALKAELGEPQLRMATPDEVEQATGSRIGAVGLVLPKLPVILDRTLFRYPFIYGGTGVEQTTLKIKPQELEKLNRVVHYLR
ncbi:YbaK/EbsC family protein [Gorillibacterium sp. CAU 1737]|uniref:aminoacyl-tRNA deacylase n=1 Tax=Gorillibacterium sp. CAU 1737 TaxID=3140362 RepID=UPI00326018CD